MPGAIAIVLPCVPLLSILISNAGSLGDSIEIAPRKQKDKNQKKKKKRKKTGNVFAFT